jgi:hypothetical protein
MESGYRSLDEWGQATGRTPQAIWDEIMDHPAAGRSNFPGLHVQALLAIDE